MRFKLDENFGVSIQKIFQDQGHDCLTVRDENLLGVRDSEVLSVATDEKRVLVTMDHDFGNVFSYPPHEASGIAVINPPGRSSLAVLHTLILTLIEALNTRNIHGRLWIVEPGRIREHESGEIAGEEDSE